MGIDYASLAIRLVPQIWDQEVEEGIWGNELNIQCAPQNKNKENIN